MNKRSIGKLKEHAACIYLQNNGLELLDRNRHIGKLGELDIVACQKGRVGKKTIVFVEVRSQHTSYIHPSQVLPVAKQRRLMLLARVWLKLAGLKEFETNWRIDLVTVSHQGKQQRIIWYKGVV